MRKKIFLLWLVTGIAFMAVPFVFRIYDRKQADRYISEFEVNENEEEDGKETASSKKKDSQKIPETAIGIIEIESLAVRYPIFEGTEGAQLDLGIGHLTGTAPLCERGNAVLAGHNGSRRGLFFTRLNEIENGAKVRVTNKSKVTHTYEVYETGVYDPFDQTVCRDSAEECLTLFTCACSGTRRFVVRCRLER